MTVVELAVKDKTVAEKKKALAEMEKVRAEKEKTRIETQILKEAHIVDSVIKIKQAGCLYPDISGDALTETLTSDSPSLATFCKLYNKSLSEKKAAQSAKRK